MTVILVLFMFLAFDLIMAIAAGFCLLVLIAIESFYNS